MESQHKFEEDLEMRKLRLSVSPVKEGPDRTPSALRKGILKVRENPNQEILLSTPAKGPSSPSQRGMLSPSRSKTDNFSKSRDKLFFGAKFPVGQEISQFQKKIGKQSKAETQQKQGGSKFYSPYSPPKEGPAPAIVPVGFYPAGSSKMKTMFSEYEEGKSYWNSQPLLNDKREGIDWKDNHLFGYFGQDEAHPGQGVDSTEASRQRQRSKSLSTKKVDQDLKFRIQMALTKSDRNKNKGVGCQGDQQQPQICKESILQEYLAFVQSSSSRVRLNEEILKKIRSNSYKEGVIILITDLIRLHELLDQERNLTQHRIAKKEQELRESEERGRQKVEEITNRLSQANQEGQSAIATYETKLASLQTDLEVSRKGIQVTEDQLALSKKQHSEEVKSLRDSISQLEATTKEAMSQKDSVISKLNADLTEVKTKASTDTANLRESINQLDKQLAAEKEQAEAATKTSQEALAKDKLHHETRLRAVQQEQGQKSAALEEQVKQLSEKLSTLQTENQDLKNAAAKAVMLPTSPESKEGDQSPSPRSTANSSPKGNGFRLAQSKAVQSEQLTKAQQEIEELKSQLSVLQGEKTATEDQLSKAVSSLHEMEISLRNKFQLQLKDKENSIAEQGDQLTQLRVALKAEEDKRTTLERILMNVSASARPRETSTELADSVSKKTGQNSVVRLLEKIKDTNQQSKTSSEGEVAPAKK